MFRNKLNFFLVFLFVFIILNNLLFLPVNILSWDVFGYYLYLPLKFIYHDLSMNDDSIIKGIIEQYNNTGTLYQALELPEDGYVLKYPMGLAVLYAPFFYRSYLCTLFRVFR